MNHRRPVPLVCALALCLIAPGGGVAQDDPPSAQGDFGANCARCHTGDGKAPALAHLSNMSARAIMASMETGRMEQHARELDEGRRKAIAEMLSGQPLTETDLPPGAYCAPAEPVSGPVAWSGWGGVGGGTAHVGGGAAGITAANVGGLEPAWAFAFPDASLARTRPALVGDHVITASPFGDVYALRRDTGCVDWVFRADAAVRGAITASEGSGGGATLFFADFLTNVYAVQASSGGLLWRTLVGRHPQHNVTGTVAVQDGVVYVPISAMEVATAMDPRYVCCTASGAVAAVSVDDGSEVWYRRMIAEEADSVGVRPNGTAIMAPSGAPVWSSPTVDSERGLLYVGTGENYTRPASDDSDAMRALDLETGEIVWSFQGTADDAFTMACGGAANGPNCPDPPGPDLDFGMAPMLVARADGSQVVVAGQKSGVVHALNPDDGAHLWSTRIGRGSALGGVHWGMATDGRYAYAPVSDRLTGLNDMGPGPAAPGLHALDLMTGEVAWYAEAPDVCQDRRGCYRAFSAAPLSIEGAVITGGLDGWLRAFSSVDGSLLWEFDTVRDFETVNGVAGRGGAFDGPGAVAADGMLFVNSGYGMFGQIPGNVLLAFRVGG